MSKKIKLLASLVFVFTFLIVQHSHAMGNSENFKTVFTDSSSDVSSTSVTLNGHKDDSNVSYSSTVIGPSYYFQYKKKGSSSWIKSNSRQTELTPEGKVVATVKGLKPNTTYQFRLVQEMGSTLNKGVSKSYGSTLSFKTSKK